MIVLDGGELNGRSTDPANLDADKFVAPEVIPYTAELWIEGDSVAFYKCVDQKEGIKLVHVFNIQDMELIARIWDNMKWFNRI